MQEQMSERELHDRLTLIESMIAGRPQEYGESGLGIRAVGRGLPGGHGVVRMGPEQPGLAGDGGRYLVADVGPEQVAETAIQAGKPRRDNGGARRLGSLDRHGHFDVYTAALSWLLCGPPSTEHLFVAVVGSMLGTGQCRVQHHFFKWKVQFGCAVVWWAAAGGGLLRLRRAIRWRGSWLPSVLCQIVFGVYCHGGRSQRAGGTSAVRSMPEKIGPEKSRPENRVPELPEPELPELNPVIHGKLRLALLSLLAGVEEAEFTWLRGKTGATDGNLGAQLLKLEEAGYIAVEKKFCTAQAADRLPPYGHGTGSA